MIAAARAGTAFPDQGSPFSAAPHAAEVRTGHRTYAGFRTRTLRVFADAARRTGRHRPPSGADGNRGREPARLVLLHGYRDSADTWRDVLAGLSAAGHSAVAVDLPGAATADPLRPGAMLPQLDAFVRAVVDHETGFHDAPGGLVLVGNSLGGTLSLRAAQNPALGATGVVSIAAPGFADSLLTRAVAGSTLPLRLWSALPIGVPAPLVRAVAAYLVPRLLYADVDAADARHVARFTELFHDHRSTTDAWEEACALLTELTGAYELGRVGVALLVVACGKDRLVSAAAGDRVRAQVPHSRLLFRPEWGHCPQLDDPAAVADVLAAFAAHTHGRLPRTA